MTRFPGIAVTLLLAVVIAVWLGCGDDNKGVNQPTVPIQGELADAKFLFADEVLQPDVVKTTGVSTYASVYFLVGLPGGLAAEGTVPRLAAVPDVFTGLVINSIDTPTISAQGWYVFNFEVTWTFDFTDTTVATGVDSLRLTLAGTPVEWIGFGTEFDALECHFRAVWSNNHNESGVSRHNATLSIIDPAIPINGLDVSIVDTAHSSIEDDSGFCYVNLYSTGTGTGILISGMQSGVELCADSGTVAINTVVDLDCTEHSQNADLGVEGLWSYQGSYDSDYVLSCKLTHGNTYWNCADTCQLPR